MTKKFERSVFWFRRDLRLRDNAGLEQALALSKSVRAVFVFDTDILNCLEDKGDARVEFIFKSVQDLRSQLQKIGSDLVVLYGKAHRDIVEYSKQWGAQAVFYNKDYEPRAIKRDELVGKELAQSSVDFRGFKDCVIFEEKEVLTTTNTVYSVFTPYSNAWRAKAISKPECMEYKKSFELLEFMDKFSHSQTVLSLADIGFKSSGIDLYSKQLAIKDQNSDKKEVYAQIMESCALVELENFIDKKIYNYDSARDYPGEEGVSRLGVHLRFGTLSIRQVLRSIEQLKKKSAVESQGVRVWLSEIIWREFYQQVLFNFPQTVELEFKKSMQNFAWSKDALVFQKWCEGNTGYPIVDAAMRELNTTGYMHNRCRMIVASFLTKHLLIDWRMGEEYFAKKLLDYECASNVGGWQWSAGCGVDAQPYFRIFNPYTQSEKFDAQGVYIKKFLPQLKDIPADQIHNPAAFEKEWAKKSVILGKDYPGAIVEHNWARKRALSALENLSR